MEAIKTIPEVVIPQSEKGYTVLLISVVPSEKRGSIEVFDNTTGERKLFTADLTTEWAGVSVANQTVIKAFLKKIVEICLETDPADITGDPL